MAVFSRTNHGRFVDGRPIIRHLLGETCLVVEIATEARTSLPDVLACERMEHEHMANFGTFAAAKRGFGQNLLFQPDATIAQREQIHSQLVIDVTS